MNKLRDESFSNILPIMAFIHTMSPSSSKSEQRVLAVKTYTNNFRSKLSKSALNHCMGIKMLALEINTFDPLPAINYWNNMSEETRPFYKNIIKSKMQILELPLVIASGDFLCYNC